MLEQIDFWHWWVLGIILLVLEMLAPSTFFLWMGISAGIVGLILLSIPALAVEYQLLAFSIFSVLSIITWRIYHKKNPTQTDRPTLNRRAEQYIGRTLTLIEPIKNGVGIVKIDDTRWQVVGPDANAGEKVEVIAAEDSKLTIKLV